MPTFPRRESDIVALTDAMLAGYTDNPGIFPSADIPGLTAVRTDYGTAKDNQIAAQAQAAMATEQKEIKIEALEEVMKQELKKSDVDCAADPEQLKLIGWGPKAPPTPLQPPAQPRNLEAIGQGHGTLHLDWKKPNPGDGGAIRNYVVMRREQEGTEMTEWHMVGSALDTEVQLNAQPRGVQMEYQVVSVNAAGESDPSNVVDVVL